VLFELAIDNRPRGCDIVKIKIGGLVNGPALRNGSVVILPKREADPLRDDA